jgi:TRAP-type mannitol/chloroaromatic compound transport system permease large subunit
MIEIALLAIALLVITLTLGVPLPYCFGAALMVMYFLGDVTMKGMMLWGFQQLGNPVLLAIPLFVLAGTIMSESGIATSLLRFVNAFIGHVRGGLGVVAAVSCAVIGAISGSGLTGIAAIGPLLIPEMEKRGYPREYATGHCQVVCGFCGWYRLCDADTVINAAPERLSFSPRDRRLCGLGLSSLCAQHGGC